MWGLWSAHVTRRLLGRLRRRPGPAGAPAESVRVVRQAQPPPSSRTGLPDVTDPTDDEPASRC
jgi:hypothetical protein